MSWNSHQELYLKNLGEQAMVYTWMQEQTATFYLKLNKIQGISIIILSGILGTSHFIDKEASLRNILFGCLGYLVSILGTLDQFLKPLEDSRQRASVGNKFQDIYYDIKQELAKSDNMRKSPDDYIRTMTEKFIELYDFSPPISGFIITRFKQKFKNTNITLTLNADFIDEIKIFKNSLNHNSNSKSSEIKIDIQKQNQKHQDYENFILSRLNNSIEK